MSHQHRAFIVGATPAQPLRFAAMAAAGPAVDPGLKLLGLEVVQSIQTLDNKVRLIADKLTVVRLYADWSAVASQSFVTAELAWRRDTGGFNYLPAFNRIEVSSTQKPSQLEQRHALDRSINFRLPEEAVREGTLQLRVHRVAVPGGPDIRLTAPLEARVEFRRAPPLRVRVIGLRYKDPDLPDGRVAPDAIHFQLLRSWLLRAYPVATLEWSQLVVDADLLEPPFGEEASDLANAQLMALRAREISSGVDPRTHYYGLVADNGSAGRFMRGSAVYDQGARVFGLIASGPAGVPMFWKWDTDPSYGDWYGAHELGHTFQRRHPGFPVGSQPRDPLEQTFPYANGLISNGDIHVGFDVGDPAWPQLPMRALPGDLHHDVMTYASDQWISAYTYEAIHDLLLDEEVRLQPT